MVAPQNREAYADSRLLLATFLSIIEFSNLFIWSKYLSDSIRSEFVKAIEMGGASFLVAATQLLVATCHVKCVLFFCSSLLFIHPIRRMTIAKMGMKEVELLFIHYFMVFFINNNIIIYH